ncbi:MAG: Zn-ribbon domain-containing OB-fold protein [Acidimicrobiaceae bacterium]|nr:Zn-ribbon domain-containing OB-fold protein [Acidimicrobiaceae bacterium]
MSPDSAAARDPLAAPAALSAPVTLPGALAGAEPVESVCTPIRMTYTYTPGRALSRYLRAMAGKRILGERCGATGQVFVPPRGVSPLAGAATSEAVELADTGYVESFNITRVPIERRPDLEPPYCSAWIVLDGASVGFLGLVIDIAPEEVRIGMRVRAVWKPDEELETSAANILGWAPTGEPDEVITDYERIGRVEASDR